MKTVLVVDDEFGILDSLQEVLSDEGFAVLRAANGKDGLKRIAERRPDLILLDCMMPIMDGPEMLQVLQRDPALRAIPVVLMSAVARSGLPLECQPAGFLRKPFDLTALLHEIARLLPPE